MTQEVLAWWEVEVMHNPIAKTPIVRKERGWRLFFFDIVRHHHGDRTGALVFVEDVTIMMIIGAPMMAPAMPHTCENSMTVSNNTSGENADFAPERLGSTSEPNTCWLPMSKASMNTAVSGSIMMKPMRTGGMVKRAPKMGMKSQEAQNAEQEPAWDIEPDRRG